MGIFAQVQSSGIGEKYQFQKTLKKTLKKGRNKKINVYLHQY